ISVAFCSPSGWWVAASTMPPASRCAVIKSAKSRSAAASSAAVGSVENPDRPMGNQRLGEGEAPLLAGGEIAERQVRDARKANGLGRLLDRKTDAAVGVAQEIFPEGQVFCNREFIFHRIPMAKVVACLACPTV